MARLYRTPTRQELIADQREDQELRAFARYESFDPKSVRKVNIQNMTLMHALEYAQRHNALPSAERLYEFMETNGVKLDTSEFTDAFNSRFIRNRLDIYKKHGMEAFR